MFVGQLSGHTIHLYVLSPRSDFGLLAFAFVLGEMPLTDSMEQRPSWEASRSWATVEIPLILWSTKVRYRIHKNPPPVPSLSLIDAVPCPSSDFSKFNFNIILPSTPGSSESVMFILFRLRTPRYIFSSTLYTRSCCCIIQVMHCL